MSNQYLFVARLTPGVMLSDDLSHRADASSPSNDAIEFTILCELPSAVNACQQQIMGEDITAEASENHAHPRAQAPNFATPNSLLQARTWPFRGQRVTRPSRSPGIRGKSALGTSRFLRGNKTIT